MRTFFTFVLLLTATMNSTIMAETKDYSKRSEVPAEFKWNLQDIYTSWDAWERDLGAR
ncbi:MAG: hypothetical protein U5L09_05980 [Bacteroidales bacterium]|nr:hypothetical protein [Bacteroidales bacterium]